MTAAAGWYQDPSQPDRWRWFDGQQWTGYVEPIQAPVPVPSAPLAAAPPPAPPPAPGPPGHGAGLPLPAPVAVPAPPSSAPVATDLPEPLRAHRGSPLLVVHLGMLGGRTLLLTDHPAVYVHDAGGLLSSERTTRLEPYVLDREEIVFADRSTKVRGALQVPELGLVWFEESSHLESVGDGLPPASAERITPLPVSVVCRFEGGEEALDGAVEEADGGVDATGQVPAAIEALGEHLVSGELHAHVEVAGGRLVLRKRGTVLCDLPVAVLQATPAASSIRVDANVRVAGLEARSLEIHLPTRRMIDRLAASLGLRSLPPDAGVHGDGDTGLAGAAGEVGPIGSGAAIDRVEVAGIVTGSQPVDATAEAVLRVDSLTLSVAGAEHRFSFDDPTLRVGGTGDRFVLLDGRAGPIRVAGVNSHLLRRLSGNDRLRLAAARTLDGGPFPCELEAGGPVAVGLDAGSVTVRGRGGDRRLGLDGLRRPSIAIRPGEVRLGLTGDGGSLDVVGPPELLAALHAAVQTETAARRFAGRTEDLLRTIVALEGDHLLYTCVGPLVEAHSLLREAHNDATGEPQLDHALELPAGDDLVSLGTDLMHGAVEAERHLEQVALQLPMFLTGRDGAILDPGAKPPVELKAIEVRYRSALGGLRGLAGQLAGVHEPLRSALGLAGIETSTDYGVAAISGLAGAMINPIFLIAGASQALAARKQAGRTEADRAGGVQRSVERSIERWNHLVRSVMPAVALQTADGLFPMRWEVARRLSKLHHDTEEPDAGALHRRLAQRLARLETFLAFPPSASVGHDRRAVVTLLKAQMARLDEADRFTPF